MRLGVNNAETDKKAYQLARHYLPANGIPGVTDTVVLKYLEPTATSPRQETVPGLYLRHAARAEFAQQFPAPAIKITLAPRLVRLCDLCVHALFIARYLING